MTTYMANFVSHIAKVLPDDIIAKLDEQFIAELERVKEKIKMDGLY